MKFHFATLAIAASLFASLSHAEGVHAGDVHIDQAYARASMPGQTSGGAYLTLENMGKQNDALLSAQSSAARWVEIHTMSMEGDIMRMREVSNIELAPGQKVAMEPGKGYHLMLIGLKAPLKAGDRIPVTLTFRKAGKVDVALEVKDNQGGASKPADDGHGKHHKH